MEKISVEKLTRSRGPAALSAAAAALYLAIPSSRYNFDGVACAIAVDLRDFRHLVHGNHLAYGLLGYFSFSLAKLLGYHGPSLYILQIFSSLLGAAAVGLFARALIRFGLAPVAAVLCAAGVAISSVYWQWSLEAQVYPLGAVCLALTLAELAREKPRPQRIGFWHAAAVLGHVGHVMFFPVVVYWMRKRPRRDWVRYVLVAAACVSGAYVAAGILCVRPSSWDELRVWLLGSAALNSGRAFLWHGGYSISGVMDWVRISLGLPGGGAAVGAAAAASAGYGWVASRRRDIAKMAVIWIAAYALLFLAWEPYTPAYRITDLFPAMLLIGLAMTELEGKMDRRIVAAFAAAGVAALAAWNLSQTILPQSDPQKNPSLQRALWVGRETPEQAWVAVSGIDQVYIPYFARRKPLILQYFSGREQDLEQRLKEISGRGEPVYLVLEELEPGWRAWFQNHPLAEKSRQNGEALYQLE